MLSQGHPLLGAHPRRARRSVEPSPVLLELIGDFVDAGLRAHVVLAGRARDADRAHDLVAGLDRQAATQRESRECIAGAGGVRPIGHALDEIGRRLAESARRVGLAVGAFGGMQAGASPRSMTSVEAAAVDDSDRNLVTHALALRERRLGDGLSHGSEMFFWVTSPCAQTVDDSVARWSDRWRLLR